MNKLTKKELDKLGIDLSNFTKEENKLILTISQIKEIRLQENKSYLIELSDNYRDEIVLYTLNGNKFPNYKYLKISVLKEAGKLIEVDSIAYDTITKQDILDVWSGWLHTDGIKVLEEL